MHRWGNGWSLSSAVMRITLRVESGKLGALSLVGRFGERASPRLLKPDSSTTSTANNGEFLFLAIKFVGVSDIRVLGDGAFLPICIVGERVTVKRWDGEVTSLALAESRSTSIAGPIFNCFPDVFRNRFPLQVTLNTIFTSLTMAFYQN